MISPQLLTPGDIDQRFNLERYYTNYFMRYYLYFDLAYPLITRVIFFDGDITAKGNLDTAWVTAILEQFNADAAPDTVLILINGNLTVEGDIRLNDHQLFLLVMGNVHCDVLVNSYDYIHITGNAHIKYVFYGYYNHGYIEVDGTVTVPYVLTNAYSVPIKAEGAVLVSLAYADKSDVINYDYTREVLADVIIPAAFDGEGNVDEEKFIEIVKSGKSPLIDGYNNRYYPKPGKTGQCR
ncbi:hypothetical protein [Chitinophaga ginsengisoli]|uniref:Uncharacterized protein n=1 Tax=Chitinophaga ginsengisoli TaxID=363837 RepID=A0A2P8G5B0_9BACT|nr:hypothetical protein [Chitinophaga ginsengisoli]PSL29147.1 hypothetical protein CLV42_107294 [Chitinophaga ginsengisoli]